MDSAIFLAFSLNKQIDCIEQFQQNMLFVSTPQCILLYDCSKSLVINEWSHCINNYSQSNHNLSVICMKYICEQKCLIVQYKLKGISQYSIKRQKKSNQQVIQLELKIFLQLKFASGFLQLCFDQNLNDFFYALIQEAQLLQIIKISVKDLKIQQIYQLGEPINCICVCMRFNKSLSQNIYLCFQNGLIFQYSLPLINQNSNKSKEYYLQHQSKININDLLKNKNKKEIIVLGLDFVKDFIGIITIREIGIFLIDFNNIQTFQIIQVYDKDLAKYVKLQEIKIVKNISLNNKKMISSSNKETQKELSENLQVSLIIASQSQLSYVCLNFKLNIKSTKKKSILITNSSKQKIQQINTNAINQIIILKETFYQQIFQIKFFGSFQKGKIFYLSF